MCGLFGYLSKRGGRVDLDRLKRIAVVTQSRGDHAFGLAWLDAHGAIRTFKTPGPATDYLDAIDACANATAIVGHCRWATHGDPADNANNHPHCAGSGWFVHNGVVKNHAELADWYGLRQRTACDSEVLGLLFSRMRGSIEMRAARTAAMTIGPLAMLGLWAKPQRLLIVRRGNPLWCGETTHGAYFGSLRCELPGLPREIPDDHAMAITAGRVHSARIA